MALTRGRGFRLSSLEKFAPGVSAARGRIWKHFRPASLVRDAEVVENHVREGRFQRSLALMTAGASLLSGLEVSYEHYRGSFGQKIMWTPLALSAALSGAGVLGFLSPLAARTVLRWTSAVTLLDCGVGFYFHVRGIARKPGGWRLPVENIVMGPPIFAPLLFGVSAYLGLIASYLRPEEAPETVTLHDRIREAVWMLSGRGIPMHGAWNCARADFRDTWLRSQSLSAFFSGFEALYSHYKNNFKYAAQWSPIIIAPALMAAAGASIKSPKAARTWLPAMSLLAIADGGVGFFYHARGVLRRPGGLKKPVYNVIYGPPIFAPLLFAACGFLGVLAALMRRERR